MDSLASTSSQLFLLPDLNASAEGLAFLFQKFRLSAAHKVIVIHRPFIDRAFTFKDPLYSLYVDITENLIDA
jgi:hypothetical protein